MGHHVFILLADVEQDAFKAFGENFSEFESGDFRELDHVFFISEWFGDAWVVSAERAPRVALDFDLAEGGRESPVVDQTTQRSLPKACQKLDRFHRLEASNDSREHAQDTSFGSCRDRAVGRRLWQKAAVTRSTEVWREDGHLAFKLKNGTVDEGLFEKEGGVVGGEARREVVRAI